MKIRILLSVAVFLFCALKAPPTAAATLHVMPDGSGDAPTIQAVLDMCEAGDTVLVAAGTYTENIIWPAMEGLKLMSDSGPEVTILDGGGVDSVILIESGVGLTTEIRGFTIQNGLAYTGGGIRCRESSSPTIRYNIITGNTATGGGAGIFYSSNSAPKIAGNTITYNTGTAAGGIGIWENCGGEISYNIITHNSGGGIGSQMGFAIISNNEIRENIGDASGGGILCNLADRSTIIGNVITNNQGSGIGCTDGASPSIEGCIIADNTGMGVYCFVEAYPVINFNNIYGNGGYGVQKAGPVDDWVDAQHNWWGDPSGPTTGEDVSGFVIFEPWSVAPFSVSDAGPPTSTVPSDLSPNYPNPFNPNTTIPFSIDKPQHVKVSMYDLTGRRVAILVDQVYGAGSHAAQWDGRDEQGRAVSSGSYLVRMETAGRIESLKIMLVR